MNTEYMLIIGLIAIVLLILVFYKVNQKKATTRTTTTPPIQKYMNKDDLADIYGRNFRLLPRRRMMPNSYMDWYYSDTDKILSIMGSRGGNASFQSRRYEGFDTIDEQSCNEDGCNVIENIDGIFVALENQMFPIKGKLTFGRRVNNYTGDPNSPDNVLITNDMNGVGADSEMDDLAGNVMSYGQGNDLLPNNGELPTIPLENVNDLLPIEDVNNLLPEGNAMISNNLTNINYPQRNYDNSLIVTTPNDVSSNLGIIKKNIYHNDNGQVVEVFRRIG